MKILSALAATALLAGCAASNPGIGLIELETAPYLRADRTLSLSFVQIQRAIFKHQASCGPGIEFSVDDKLPSYARVTKVQEPGAGWNQTRLLSLVLMENGVVKARVYSYFNLNSAQIKELYDAVLHPEVCHPAG